MNFGVNTSFTQTRGYDLNDRPNSLTGNGNFNSMIYTFSYSATIKRASRDIAPKWGFAANFYKRDLLSGSPIDGGLTSYQSNIFLPGLFNHHSLRIRAAFQNQNGFKTVNGAPNKNLYLFGSPIFFPRGQTYRGFESLTTLSAEYRMPLFEPDWAMGRILYVKRIKLNLFADYGYGSTNFNFSEIRDGKQVNLRGLDQKTYNSFGIDLTAQFHIMRFSQQFEAGFRAIYLNDKGQFLIQPLVLDIGF